MNIVDFWLVRFVSVETEDISKNKFIGWIKDNPRKYSCKLLFTTAFTIILKYSMIKMRISKRDMYQLTVITLIHSI